ncbi:MAG TPA: cytochrome d ubiquinol oxidase subunit II [Fimbriimonas sp.]
MIDYPFDLQTAWFLLVGVLLIGYAILDGFDLGVGALLLKVKNDADRRVLLNSIGPVWDGNEVWLVVGGGALFAAFYHVYATVFSAFYLPLMLLLMGLIFRAVAIEFRSKEPSPRWRHGWDIAFCVASAIIPVLMGVALGNIVLGIPVAVDMEYRGGFFNLLNPYSLIVGVTTLSLFMMHGSIYLLMKTEGALQEEVKRWVRSSMIFFGVMYGLLTIATFVFAPHMAAKIQNEPWLFLLPVVSLLAIANIPREVTRGKEANAFTSSALSIASLLGLFGLGMYPNMVPSSLNPSYNLTIRNASSSEATLTVMLTIALIGMPFVVAYTLLIYHVFRGKVNRASLHY